MSDDERLDMDIMNRTRKGTKTKTMHRYEKK